MRLARGDFSLCHYKGFLRETYHHAGLNPQIQAMCTMFLKGRPRKIIKKFYQHAISEIGHDLLALADLGSLGVDKESIVNSRPLASTIAYNAYPLYEIQFCNPLSYLGYLFHLEFMPTQGGSDYIKSLKKVGVPDSALTFLEEHRSVDEQHNTFMKSYLEELIQNEKDLDDVIHATRNSCQLHGRMIVESFQNGEKLYS